MPLPFGFSQPDSGEMVKLADFPGHLVVITVRGHETGIITRFTRPGETDEIVKITLIEVDGPQPGTIHEGALFGAVVYRLIPEAGRDPIIARIGQGQAKGGNNPPWALLPFNEQDMTWVQNMFNARPDLVAAATPRPAPPTVVHTPPAEAPPAGAPNPWGNGAPAQAPAAPAPAWGPPQQAQPAPAQAPMNPNPWGTQPAAAPQVPAQAPAAAPTGQQYTPEQRAAMEAIGIKV
jgi:hypothetical protein